MTENTREKAWWTPTPAEMAKSHVDQLRRRVERVYEVSLPDYWALHKWTCDHANTFWSCVWEWQGIVGERGQHPLFDASRDMRDTKHLIPHAKVNFAENALRSHANANSDRQALICSTEAEPGSRERHLRTLSWRELHAEVAQCANALRAAGVGPGDRVAAYTPNNAEAVVFVLAAAAIGAASSTVAGEFGVGATLERLMQIKPVVLLTADAYRYNGQVQPLLPKAIEVAKKLKDHGLRQVLVVGQLNRDRVPRERLPESIGGVRVTSYFTFFRGQATTVEFWRGPAMSPLWILFSSGTTGQPKCIIHTHGGMTLCAKALHAFSSNLGTGDVVFQFTTMSWMMAQWLIMCLLVGSSILCYDGSPFGPMSVLWDLVDEHRCTRLGISPRYLQVLQANSYRPCERHSLASLSTITTTGSPLKSELYDFIREAVSPSIFLNNGSGGTDVCCAFVGDVRILPIYKGQLSAPVLGCALEVWTDEGERAKDGEEGNMVITRPFPNEPLGFLGDVDGKRFHDAYFATFASKHIVWDHSDWLVRKPGTKGYVILGRSDAVLNPSGVRFGSAEIYAAVEDLKDVVDDCIAVAQKLPDGDERVVLFIKTVEDRALQTSDVDRIKSVIRSKLSGRHVPAVILATPAIPYTTTGKRIEVAVKKVINGVDLAKVNRSAMANPESLAWYVDLPQLRLGKGSRAKL